MEQAGPTVERVPAGRVDQAVAALTVAFADDPVSRWMYPSAQGYLAHFPALVRAFGVSAFESGGARSVHAMAGVALWLAPSLHPDEVALAAILQRDVPESLRDEAGALFAQMDGYHPHRPHWYLPLIGVDPMERGRGFGSLLLEAPLVECDRARQPAYLESTNPRNVSLYQRHGFEVLGTIRVGSAPPMIPMLREPR
ncbi:GNAT family N-acetyltransferase [Angustibacter sp. McL0619]|uniref:GNAT family N-acetyltransferase n=1 Tax=Angustibacter sp. McL0619 TaxID=3415676 RepID=UPI003CFB6720